MVTKHSLFRQIATVITFAVLVVVLVSCKQSAQRNTDKLWGDYAKQNLTESKQISDTITKEDVYTYKIPASLDLTKVLTTNFEKDRPQTKEIDSFGKPTNTIYYEFDSFLSEANDIKQGIPRSVEKYIDYTNLKLKKVSEFSDLEKLTLYSSKGIEPLSGKESLYLNRISDLLGLCMGYYRETGNVPDDMWNFGFFRDTVLLEFGDDWKADFDELIAVEPGCAYFISPITGEFFSFNNPQYKKGQMYIQAITDQNYLSAYNMVGPNHENLEINKNCWLLYYRVYGEDENTIIKEDVWISLSEDLL